MSRGWKEGRKGGKMGDICNTIATVKNIFKNEKNNYLKPI